MPDLRKLLEKKLTKKELGLLKTSFDIIGNVAVLELDPKLRKKQKIVVKALLKIHPYTKTVLNKTGERKGKLRLRKLKIIFGKETETVHTEYGAKYKLDVKDVYFSPRELTERQRIAGLVRPGETVMVFFSGVGPYCIAIGKKQPGVEKIIGIELNKKAHEYALENVRLNNLQEKFTPVFGDVKYEAGKFYNKCDRVIMPLPLEGYKFLDTAIKCLKKKGTVHFYCTGHEKDLFGEGVEQIKKLEKKTGRKIRIVRKTKVLPYGPRVYKVCLDLKTGKKS